MAFRFRPLKNSGLASLAGLGISSFVTRWMETLDYKAVYYDPASDPAALDFEGPAIYVFWHEYIPFLFYLRGHCKIAMLVSKHQDAEWLSQSARHMGFSLVRGSSKRGGDAALRELIRRGKDHNLAITPDGPRGPRRRMAAGAVYLSSALQIPIVPIGLAYDRPRRLPTWDRFAVPRPGSRARGVVAPPLRIPPALDRADLERYRALAESWLQWASDEAESWAGSRRSFTNQFPVARQPAALARGVAAALKLEFARDEMFEVPAPPIDETQALPCRLAA